MSANEKGRVSNASKDLNNGNAFELFVSSQILLVVSILPRKIKLVGSRFFMNKDMSAFVNSD